MSKRINVNPDHYKTAGRERPTTIAAERMKRRTGQPKRAAAKPPAPSKRSKARPSSGGR
jgi:hypothetical protein